jgi:integrase
VVKEGETRKAFVYATEQEALTVRENLLSSLKVRQARTIGQVAEEYLAFKREMGLRHNTIRACSDRLLCFLPLDENIGSLTVERAESLYREHTKSFAVATHHKTLRESRAFFYYAQKKRYVDVNPFVEVRPIGRANAGKPQLRKDEARKLSVYLVEQAQQGDWKALALLVQVLLGVRSAELLGLKVRDFDEGATVVWVDGKKNRNAKRRVELHSATVIDLVKRRCATLPASALVFAEVGAVKPFT